MNPIPDQTRYAKKVALNAGYGFEILDKGENCLFRISKGQKSFIAGSGSLSSYPLNNAFSANIARDKIFTNHLLDTQNVPNLGGRCFFLSPEGRALRGDGYEIEDAFSYLENLDGPAFCKPLRGSQGSFAEIVKNTTELKDYIDRCSKKFDAIVIQKYFEGTEYRVFMLGEEPLFCLKKGNVELLGDGQSRIIELLAELNSDLISKGISPYSNNIKVTDIDGTEIQLMEIPKLGQKLSLQGRKNISSGATPLFISLIPEILKDLALKSQKALGLEISGIDFMCEEKDGEIFEARVIEVNSNPAISSLEMVGRWDLIERVWLYVIEKCL